MIAYYSIHNNLKDLSIKSVQNLLPNEIMKQKSCFTEFQ